MRHPVHSMTSLFNVTELRPLMQLTGESEIRMTELFHKNPIYRSFLPQSIQNPKSISTLAKVDPCEIFNVLSPGHRLKFDPDKILLMLTTSTTNEDYAVLEALFNQVQNNPNAENLRPFWADAVEFVDSLKKLQIGRQSVYDIFEDISAYLTRATNLSTNDSNWLDANSNSVVILQHCIQCVVDKMSKTAQIDVAFVKWLDNTFNRFLKILNTEDRKELFSRKRDLCYARLGIGFNNERELVVLKPFTLLSTLSQTLPLVSGSFVTYLLQLYINKKIGNSNILPALDISHPINPCIIYVFKNGHICKINKPSNIPLEEINSDNVFEALAYLTLPAMQAIFKQGYRNNITYREAAAKLDKVADLLLDLRIKAARRGDRNLLLSLMGPDSDFDASISKLTALACEYQPTDIKQQVTKILHNIAKEILRQHIGNISPIEMCDLKTITPDHPQEYSYNTCITDYINNIRSVIQRIIEDQRHDYKRTYKHNATDVKYVNGELFVFGANILDAEGQCNKENVMLNQIWDLFYEDYRGKLNVDVKLAQLAKREISLNDFIDYFTILERDLEHQLNTTSTEQFTMSQDQKESINPTTDLRSRIVIIHDNMRRFI